MSNVKGTRPNDRSRPVGRVLKCPRSNDKEANRRFLDIDSLEIPLSLVLFEI